MAALALVFDLIAKDGASPAFNRAAVGADRMAAATARAQASLKSTSASMAALGSRLTRSVTVPLLGIAGVSAKLATDFNTSMTRIQTQAGASAKDVKTLSAQVLNLSKSAQQGPVDLANALYHLKSVGMANVPAMKALGVASKLAAVGGADLEDTTNALAGAWRTGIQGAKSFRNAAAEVNAIIGSGNMTMEQFTEGISTGVLPAAKTFGLTLKDVGAAMALFTDEGVPANAAMTRFRMSVSLLGAPTAAAAKQLATIGLSSTQLAKDMRSRPNGLLVAMTDLKSHLDGLSKVDQAQLLSRAFGGGRSSATIMSMINNLDVLAQKYQQNTRLFNTFGASVRAQAATPAAQFHKAIAGLETAGVQLGNAVLPDIVKLVHGITDLATWFNNLNPSVKRFIVVFGGIAALAGPLLSITARIARLVSLFASGISTVVRFAGGMRQAEMSMSSMGSASYAAGNRVGGFFSTYGKGLGIIGATVGVAALAGKAITDITDADTDQAFASLAASWKSLNTAIVNATGNLKSVSVQWANANIQSSGLADKAALAGISINDMSKAIRGNDAQFANLIARWKASGAPSQTTLFTLASMHEQYKKLAPTIAATGKAVGQTDHAYDGAAAAAANAEGKTKGLNTTTHNLGMTFNNTILSVKGLSKALDNLGGKQLNTDQANIAMRQGIDAMAQSWDKSSNAIIGNSKAALNNRSILDQQVANIKAYAQSVDHGANATLNVNNALKTGKTLLRNMASQLHVGDTQWHQYIQTIHLTPSDITTTLHVKAAEAKKALRATLQMFDSLHDKTLHIYVNRSNQGGSSRQTHAGYATGGSPANGWFWSGERGPELNYKQGPNLRIFPAGQSKGIAAMMGMKVPGYANGTPGITTTTVGGDKKWVFRGTKYASLTAAENAQHSWEQQQAKKSRELAQSAVSAARSTLSGIATSGSSFNFAAFERQLIKATSQIMTARIEGANEKTLLKMNEHLAKIEKQGDRAEKRLGRQLTGKDTTRLLNSTGSVSQESSAFAALMADAKEAGLLGQNAVVGGHTLGISLGDLLKQQNKSLAYEINQRSHLQSKLAAVQSKFKDLVNSTKSAAAGYFDITSAASPSGKVTGTGIEAQQRQAVAQIRQWAHGLDQLRARGLNTAYWRQLASNPSSLPQIKALLSLPSLKMVNRQESEILRIGRGVGTREGNNLYGATERNLRSQIRHEDRDIKNLAKAMSTELKNAVDREVKAIERRKVELVLTQGGKPLAKAVNEGNNKNKRQQGNR